MFSKQPSHLSLIFWKKALPHNMSGLHSLLKWLVCTDMFPVQATRQGEHSFVLPNRRQPKARARRQRNHVVGGGGDGACVAHPHQARLLPPQGLLEGPRRPRHLRHHPQPRASSTSATRSSPARLPSPTSQRATPTAPPLSAAATSVRPTPFRRTPLINLTALLRSGWSLESIGPSIRVLILGSLV
jgi:hypothetical protein